MRLRYVMRNEVDEPIGRLHVDLQPAWKKTDGSPILTMHLTARGAPLAEGTDGAFAFLDLGRRWIVNAFEDLTTPDMQHVWERIDA